MIIVPGILSQVAQTGFSSLNQVRNRQKLWKKFRVLFHKMSFKKKQKKIRRVKAIKQARSPDISPMMDAATTTFETEAQITLN